MTVGLSTYCLLRSFLVTERSRLGDERGEGVISAAIAVLIVAAVVVVIEGTNAVREEPSAVLVDDTRKDLRGVLI